MASSQPKGAIIKVGLCGAAGRMGREIFRAAALCSDVVITKAYEISGHRSLGAKIGEATIQPDEAVDFLDDCQVLVDFSSPSQALIPHIEKAAQLKIAAVIGSTGLVAGDREHMQSLSAQIPLLYSANMSLGVSLLCVLAQRVQELLPGAFDIDVIEMHHRAKRDAPSGTALLLEQQIRLVSPEQKVSHHSLRAGDVIGDHTILFTGVGERLELTHRAASREAFAQGTMAAVRFIIAQKPGIYDMRQVLGI
jgi:4-hydroxy-tetrahydrodipicolinate reductase